MRYHFTKLFILAAFLTFSFRCLYTEALTSSMSPKAAVVDSGVLLPTNGILVGAYNVQDLNTGNLSVVGFIGSVSTSPSSWTYTTLSSSLGGIAQDPPKVISNSNGDVVIYWTYVIGQTPLDLAVAMLPSGTTTWNIARVTTDQIKLNPMDDPYIAMDTPGNILAIWTALNNSSGTYYVAGSTAKIGASTTWSAPFQISQ